MDNKIQATLLGGYRITSAILYQRLNCSINLPHILFGISVLTFAVLLSACSASTSTPAPTTVLASINIPVPTATPAPTSVQQQAGASGSFDPLDPCQLIDSQEASVYAGETFGPGMEETTSGGGKYLHIWFRDRECFHGGSCPGSGLGHGESG